MRRSATSGPLGGPHYVRSPEARADALIALVALDSASSALQEEAIVAISEISQSAARAAAFTGLAGYLQPGEYRSAMLGRALAEASAIDDTGLRATGLAAMIPRLPGWDNPAADVDGRRAVARALSDARACGRPTPLPLTAAALVPVMPETERRAVLSEAMVTAYLVHDLSDRAAVLTALIPHLTEPGRSEAISLACAAAREVHDQDLRKAALSGVLSAAPEALRQQAEGVARAAGTVRQRIADLNATLAACGRAIEDHPTILPAILADPALALSAGVLPPRTPEQQRTAVGRCAEHVVVAIGDLRSRADTLLTMTVASFGAAMGISGGPVASQAIAKAWLAVGALRAQLCELPGTLDDEMRAAVQAMRDANSWAAGTSPETAWTPSRARAGQPPPPNKTRYADLAQHTPAGSFPRWEPYWREVIDNAVLGGRATLITDLSAMGSVIAHAGGRTAVQETIKALFDVGRWWP